MPTQVQWRRGTTTQHNSFTGAAGEVTVDTTLDTIRVHDGSTAGGIRLAKFSEITTGDITAVVAGTGLSGGATSGSATLALSHLGLESLSDPNDDQIVFWDDSAGATAFLDIGSGLAISGTTLSSSITQYADSDARGAVSVTDSGGDGSLAYNSSTGVITYTGPSAAEVRAHLSAGTGVTYSGGAISIGQAVSTSSNVTFADVTASSLDISGNVDVDGTLETDALTIGGSTLESVVEAFFSASDAGGDGSFSYSAGVFTYTGPSASEVRAHLSAGTGVSYSGGAISIGQAVATTSDVTFADVAATGNVTITGNLDVNGTTTTLDTTNSTIVDRLIELGNGTTGTPANDMGLVFERGSSDNVFVGWDESADAFVVGTGSFTGASTGDLTYTIGNITGGVGTFASLDISGNVDVDGTLETDALTINGTASLAFESADHSKLDGIEAGATADQTNAEIRTAVEAASDSNVFTDADHSKLDGIEASATADQSDTEIKTAYENNSDTNAFTDALLSKLNGIEASATADQTDEEIQDIVGAMFSSNTETGITATYQDADGTIDLVVGTLNQNTTGTAASWTTARTLSFTGDVTGSGSVDGSANVATALTIAADAVEQSMIADDAVGSDQIANNAVALGTQTTGNYMAQVSGGDGITISHSQGEGSTATITGTAIYNAAGTKLN